MANEPSRSEIRARIVALLEREFGIDTGKVRDDASFRGTFVMDSSDVIDFIGLLEAEFALAVDIETYQSAHTLGELVDLIAGRLHGEHPSEGSTRA